MIGRGRVNTGNDPYETGVEMKRSSTIEKGVICLGITKLVYELDNDSA